MDEAAMVRYVAGELRLPPTDVTRIVRAFAARLEGRAEDEPGAADVEIDLDGLVRAIVEETMLPRGQVQRTIETMLALQAKLEDAGGRDADPS